MHECPYPQCTQRVPAQMFACKPHWFSLPPDLRGAIWRAYRRDEPGELAEAHGEAYAWWDRNLAEASSG